MQAAGRAARDTTSIYFSGGATAVLYGWRETTLDIDIKIVPDSDELLRAIAELKERLRLNIEIASPDLFIPVPEYWQAASPFIQRVDNVSFHHFFFEAQAVSKIERGQQQDLADVREMVARGLVQPTRLLEYYRAVEPLLYRYPAIDPESLRRAIISVEDDWRSAP